MKKNILIGFGCAVLLLFATSAYSAQGMYFSGNLGFAMLGDSGLKISELDEELQWVEEMLEEEIENELGVTGVDVDLGYDYNFESKMGVALGVALGYDFGGNIRLEGELAYQTNDIDKATFTATGSATYMGQTDSYSESYDDDVSGDTSSLAMLANVYYDFHNSSTLTPFVTAGIGYAKVEVNFSSEILEAENESEDDMVFAYQLGVGCGFAVSETLTLDLKYRYFATQNPDFDGVEAEYSSSNVYLGVRVGF